MLKAKWSKLVDRLRGRPRIILLAVPCCLLVLTLYIAAGRELESFVYTKAYSSEDDITDGYLVWNPKCHMLSKDPMDSSIKRYVVKEKFEKCSTGPPGSYVKRDPTNGNASLVLNEELFESRKGAVTCCWAPIVRPAPSHPPKDDWDTTISVGKCDELGNRRAVELPPDVEVAMITCRRGKTTIHKNVHPIINPEKVRDRLEREANSTKPRKLSVLVLGIDSVSRLNFKRSMPKTESYLRDSGNWFNLQGYNKMGENTFPNLMAILTGLNSSEAYANCKPTTAYGLDKCPMLWYGFRDAGYATAYGEDLVTLGTFNYHKVGFVEPPTDYYLRPYIQAAEKLLKVKKRFGSKYCTGPEIHVERVFDYAIEFARTFLGSPYFGFFWTNSVSHEDPNGISSMDERMRGMLERIEAEGIADDAMIVFLSDHGTRWGEMRQTFVGWYEERLPFIYVKLPDWFSKAEPDARRALRLNENRLSSPYDLYETLREILARAGVEATASRGCSTCRSLFHPVPLVRGCPEAGISPHWCTCATFRPIGSNDKEVVLEGAHKFLEHVESIIDRYRDKAGKRLCSVLGLGKILRVDELVEPRNGTETSAIRGYFYLIEVTPGGGRYEATVRHHGDRKFTVREDEIGRINSYASSSACLDHGSKRYCHCIGK